MLMAHLHAGAQTDATAATGSQPPVTIQFSQAQLQAVLRRLDSLGYPIILRGKIQDTTQVSIAASNEPIESVLAKLAGPRDWTWYRNPSSGQLELWDRQSFDTEVLPTMMIDKTISLEHIRAEDVVPTIQGLINQGKGASISVDARTNKIFLRDLPEVVAQIERLLSDLDVNLVTRVFRIRHAEIETLADKLSIYKSGPGTIDVDVRTRQIFVTDIEQNIRRMELLIDVLDIGPEMRVYDLNNIGFEGEDLDEVLKAVEQVLTEGAFYQMNFRTGTLLVEDVDEVHDLIEQILAAVDPPQKQVLIEAEILETNFNNSFNFSLNGTFSEDLFAAAYDGLVDVETGEAGASPDGLGFANFRDTFPIVGAGSTGLNILNLSSRARLQLTAALTDSDTQLLQQPRLIVKNQQTARIEVGQELPFANTLPSSGTNDRLFTQIQTVRVGLFMEISPSISNNGLVELEILFENNGGEPVEIRSSGEVVTAIRRDTQEIETTLIVPSGETRMIGGLVRSNRSNSVSGVPILSKIPVIGPFLFGSFSNSDNQRQIMVFLTPTIIEELPPQDRGFSRPPTFEELRAIRSGVHLREDRASLRGRSMRGALVEAREGTNQPEGRPDENAQESWTSAPEASVEGDGDSPSSVMNDLVTDLGTMDWTTPLTPDPFGAEVPSAVPASDAGEQSLLRSGTPETDPAMAGTLTQAEDVAPVETNYSFGAGSGGITTIGATAAAPASQGGGASPSAATTSSPGAMTRMTGLRPETAGSAGARPGIGAGIPAGVLAPGSAAGGSQGTIAVPPSTGRVPSPAPNTPTGSAPVETSYAP